MLTRHSPVTGSAFLWIALKHRKMHNLRRQDQCIRVHGRTHNANYRARTKVPGWSHDVACHSKQRTALFLRYGVYIMHMIGFLLSSANCILPTVVGFVRTMRMGTNHLRELGGRGLQTLRRKGVLYPIVTTVEASKKDERKPYHLK